jgi:ABC-2 type transport system permease protein
MRLALRQGILELKQFARSVPAVVFTLFFPVMLLVIFGAIFTGTIQMGPNSEIDFTQYFAAGMIASGLMSVGFQNLAISIPSERDRGVLKRLRGTPMPRWVYFAGKIIMVAVLATVSNAILLLVAHFFYDVPWPRTAAKWGTLIWVSLLGVTAFGLCGIAYARIVRNARAAPAVVTPVALLLQFISGVFFVFTELPTKMQQFAALFPLKWLCQGMRSVFLPDAFGDYEPGGGWELGKTALILGAWCIGALVMCLLTFRWTSHRDG